MWYLLKVDAMIAAFVFVPASLMILALFAWQEAKAFAAARHRIANPLAISRNMSRHGRGDRLTPHRIQ